MYEATRILDMMGEIVSVPASNVKRTDQKVLDA